MGDAYVWTRGRAGGASGFTNVFCPRRGLSGGLDVVESTFSSFRCRYPGACRHQRNGGQRSAAAMARTEREAVRRSSEASTRLAAARMGGQAMLQPPNPRPHHTVGRDMRVKQSALLARPRFLSSTVHGAFSLFAKERMGGALPGHHHGLRLPRASAPKNLPLVISRRFRYNKPLHPRHHRRPFHSGPPL